ncbi:MAG: hypothetical protein JXB49_11520 [Bacteroidales bacterium]|nr:hypothetical protein [Bacteroidales bacterium]
MENRKITVKHYLNKRAKAKIFQNERFYPLYIQIIVNARKAQIKSKINEHLSIYRSDIDRISKYNKELNDLLLAGYMSDMLLEKSLTEELFPIFHLLQDEVHVLTKIIRFQDPFNNENFSLSNFSVEYTRHVSEITTVLDENIKKQYLDELNRIFLKSIDHENDKDVFRISNYLIHFINWDNRFINFYEATYEILPSEIKFIENHLAEELATAIKAYKAYHAIINVLKRFFEKRELGKISTLSYLDWVTDIKAFVLKEFEKLFGTPKAIEYVNSLDEILIKNVKG